MRLIDAEQLKQLRADIISGKLDIKTEGDLIDACPTINPYEWISVEDRLPEIETANIKEYSRHYSKSARVLCVCKQKSGKVMVKEGYYETSSNDTRIYWKIPGSIDSVTHWMPLPAPPTEK